MGLDLHKLPGTEAKSLGKRLSGSGRSQSAGLERKRRLDGMAVRVITVISEILCKVIHC